MALITLSKQYARHPARPVHDMVRIFADSTPAEVWVVTFPLTLFCCSNLSQLQLMLQLCRCKAVYDLACRGVLGQLLILHGLLVVGVQVVCKTKPLFDAAALGLQANRNAISSTVG